MKKNFLFLFVLTIVTLACGLPQAATPTRPAAVPTNTITPPSETPVQNPEAAITATEPAPTFEGKAESYGPLSLVLPAGLASGISGNQFPRVEGEGIAPWEVTPGHTQIDLNGYPLQGKFHQPRIYIYPAQDYAEMFPAAFESIRRLDNILYSSDAPKLDEPLPSVPFFNAGQIFTSNVQAIPFQNGGGVRFLTEYAQYTAPVNNHELIYLFQGVTRDGVYYVIAILPVTAPELAETSDPGAPLPANGVVFPDISDPNANYEAYYAAVSNLLNTENPDGFTPPIGQLDLLIQSLQIAP